MNIYIYIRSSFIQQVLQSPPAVPFAVLQAVPRRDERSSVATAWWFEAL